MIHKNPRKVPDSVVRNLDAYLEKSKDDKDVFLNFGTSKQEDIASITKNKLEQYFKNGEFQKGTIEPKIKAAIHFLKYQGEKVIITSIPCIKEAFDGDAGTTIRNET